MAGALCIQNRLSIWNRMPILLLMQGSHIHRHFECRSKLCHPDGRLQPPEDELSSHRNSKCELPEQTLVCVYVVVYISLSLYAHAYCMCMYVCMYVCT